MSKLSTSFTLGKASGPGGANVAHNNREFISANVDVSRLADNVTYIRQDVREVYAKLFGDVLEQYNANQKRNDRKIHDYFEHVSAGNREEPYYEAIIQFGDSETASIGSENGETAKKMLDQYVRNFEKRNPQMRIFNAVLHADESSYHVHIDFIPFYTQSRQKGLSKGVSMRAALEEQGFTNTNKSKNSLVAWEDSELKAMESILNQHGLERDVKGVTHSHKSVPDYKNSQDWRKLPKRKKRTQSERDVETIVSLERDVSVLKIENERLHSERNSSWKSFYYSDPDKQIFVQSELSNRRIPYRESEHDFEAQQCYVNDIRKIEKQYVSTPTSHRDILRNRLDKIVMQVSSYDKIFDGLKFYGYEIKHGKYAAVKPKDGSQFIRLKSLGEMYNEQALRNRIRNRIDYENQINNRIDSFDDKQSLECRIYLTVKQYIVTFKSGTLPARKTNPKQPFTFINDAELDRLAGLNKQLNEGVTLISLRNDLSRLEKSIANLEGIQNHCDVENHLLEERAKLVDTSDTLIAFEKIASLTYVDSLVNAENERLQSAKIGNGIKSATASANENNQVGAIAERVAETVTPKAEEPIVQNRAFKRKM
ncbi:MAG: plasmid recombination protein [Oscillospiraceae bacterium]|nr:plasmid recombination protein [Oscillospiraceae bacterium]